VRPWLVMLAAMRRQRLQWDARNDYNGQWAGAKGETGTDGSAATFNAPSVLVTAGRLVLLVSFGEDILEFWGEVRAIWVAAAMVRVVT